jgi:hypothetical protein
MLFIAPGGRITTNAAATRILVGRGIRSVLLLWDPIGHKVALKAAPKGDQNSYTLSVARGSSGRLRARSFLKYIGWNASEREMVPATWNDKEKLLEGILTVENLGKKSKPGKQQGGQR